MTDAVWVVSGVTAVVALVDWWSVATGAARVERWAKPAVLVGLLAVALLAGAADTAPGRWALLALLLGLAGDVLLLEQTEGRFLGGLVAFLLGHLAWVAAFVTLGLDRPSLAWFGVALVAGSLVVARPVVAAADRDGGRGLAGALTAYLAVIGAMAVTGWATGRLLIAAGATLFVVSDMVLALGRFVAERRWTGPVVMVTYHLAQALLLAGVLAT